MCNDNKLYYCLLEFTNNVSLSSVLHLLTILSDSFCPVMLDSLLKKRYYLDNIPVIGHLKNISHWFCYISTTPFSNTLLLCCHLTIINSACSDSVSLQRGWWLSRSWWRCPCSFSWSGGSWAFWCSWGSARGRRTSSPSFLSLPWPLLEVRLFQFLRLNWLIDCFVFYAVSAIF